MNEELRQIFIKSTGWDPVPLGYYQAWKNKKSTIAYYEGRGPSKDGKQGKRLYKEIKI